MSLQRTTVYCTHGQGDFLEVFVSQGFVSDTVHVLAEELKPFINIQLIIPSKYEHRAVHSQFYLRVLEVRYP